jgi:murein DD-endopeptidase MepM/ murein hydrolase activator NlpD
MTNTPFPTLTNTPTPTPTPTLWLSSPVRTNGNLPDWIQYYGYTEFAAGYSYGTKDKVHGGMDLGRYYSRFEEYNPSVERSGVPVYAATNGNVVGVELYKGLGRVKISLPDGSTGFYDHLDPEHIMVRLGDPVSNDTTIGYLEVTEKHLHLERRPGNGVTVTNPLPFFEPTVRNSFLNWPKNERTRYNLEYEWQGGIWVNPLIQPDTSY